MEKQNWDSLKKTCSACTGCGLCKTRHNVVFGDGNENAGILFVGEGPGEQEDLQGLLLFWRGGCGGGRSIEFSAHCAPYA